MEASLRDVARSGDTAPCKVARKTADATWKETSKDLKALSESFHLSARSSFVLPKVWTSCCVLIWVAIDVCSSLTSGSFLAERFISVSKLGVEISHEPRLVARSWNCKLKTPVINTNLCAKDCWQYINVLCSLLCIHPLIASACIVTMEP